MAFLSQLSPVSDTILLSRLPFHLNLGLDAWSRPAKSQPVYISLELSHSVVSAASDDDVSLTLDYGKLYKRLSQALDFLNSNYSSDITLQGLVNTIDSVVVPEGSEDPAQPGIITVELPKACLRCVGGLRYSAIRLAAGSGLYACGLEINKIDCACIVGVNPHERLEKQTIYVSLEFRAKLSRSHAGEGEKEELPNSTFCTWEDMGKVLNGGYQKITREVSELVSGTSFQTLESLATSVARHITMSIITSKGAVTVTLEKPSAIAMVEAAGVRITRTRKFFEESGKGVWDVVPADHTDEG